MFHPRKVAAKVRGRHGGLFLAFRGDSLTNQTNTKAGD